MNQEKIKTITDNISETVLSSENKIYNLDNECFSENDNTLDISISPSNDINKDIINQFGPINLNQYLGLLKNQN